MAALERDFLTLTLRNILLGLFRDLVVVSYVARKEDPVIPVWTVGEIPSLWRCRVEETAATAQREVEADADDEQGGRGRRPDPDRNALIPTGRLSLPRTVVYVVLVVVPHRNRPRPWPRRLSHRHRLRHHLGVHPLE